MRPAKLSLQGERRHSQNEDCSLALHPSPGTYPPSLICARFWPGAVLNSHSTRASNWGDFASLNKRDKRTNSTYEGAVIHAHTASQQRSLEELHNIDIGATIDRLERRGKPRGIMVLSGWKSAGIGTQYHQELVDFSRV